MNANDKSWSNETIALFDKLEAQIRQQQAEIEALKFGKEAAKAWSVIKFKAQEKWTE